MSTGRTNYILTNVQEQEFGNLQRRTVVPWSTKKSRYRVVPNSWVHNRKDLPALGLMRLRPLARLLTSLRNIITADVRTNPSILVKSYVCWGFQQVVRVNS